MFAFQTWYIHSRLTEPRCNGQGHWGDNITFPRVRHLLLLSLDQWAINWAKPLAQTNILINFKH